MHTDEALRLRSELQSYGINGGDVRLFDSPTPELLDYMDLVEPRGLDKQKALFPDGVAESLGRPLLFFVNESHLSLSPQEESIQFDRLRRILACRGDRTYLARIRPGELSVVPVSLSDRTPRWKLYKAETSEARTFFSRLVHGRFDGEGEPDEVDFLFKQMLNLLNQGADRLAQTLGPANVLSLLGRALFFRFLCDRDIVTEQDTKHIAPQASSLMACFDNAENAYATSYWLDRTFNGDFLPLEDGGSRDFFDKMALQSNSVFFHLSAIVQRFKPVGTDVYQTRLNWNDFDFAHIPVGLLSQVYEAFCWKWEHRYAKETSVYYTPRNIAATLVDEAFDGLPEAHRARVLDPACGAGVFLVLAFRRLYRERWKAIGRPDTEAIREILEKQITGFDISSSALKLTALGLYLTAIELDPKPIPPEKLRFKEVGNVVLFNHRQPVDSLEGPVIGSLGDHVGTKFDLKFDLILSNPPWTTLSKEYKSLAAEFTNISKSIIERKNEKETASKYRNPDSAPDLPFLWKSTEWCRPGGRIAMVLPARILFKQEDIPSHARETIFRLIEVTGIINGSNLSDTEVWPKMSQPFMLLFARNQHPQGGHVIRFITAQYDKILNRKGEVRIDSKSIQFVEPRTVFDEPWLWKTLSIGTSLDAQTVRRIKATRGRPLQKYWETDLGLVSRNGYQIKEKQTQRDASFLRGLPDLNSTKLFTFLVKPDELQPFSRSKVCWPRKREVYKAPLALVLESPGPSRENGWAQLSFKDVAFTQSFYGYSGAGHPEGELLVRYVHLFIHSLIWIYYALLTSPKFGAERRSIYKDVLDECPIIPLSQLTTKQRDQVLTLSKRLEHEKLDVFQEIDTFFGELYGLDELDLEVIYDTISVCLPYGESRAHACESPTAAETEIFRKRLELVLKPFFRVLGKDPRVTVWKPDDTFLQEESPFGAVFIGEQGSDSTAQEGLNYDVILKLAAETGTTRIIQHLDHGLTVSILRQYRYWTPSRARLLAAEIIRQHMDVFED